MANSKRFYLIVGILFFTSTTATSAPVTGQQFCSMIAKKLQFQEENLDEISMAIEDLKKAPLPPKPQVTGFVPGATELMKTYKNLVNEVKQEIRSERKVLYKQKRDATVRIRTLHNLARKGQCD